MHGGGRVRSVTIIAALGAVTFLSLLGDGRDGFWANHPMLGALFSGGLLFAIGVFVVERYVERRNAQRWSAAAMAASRDLGHLLDLTLASMWCAHSPPDPGTTQRTDKEWTPAWRARQLELSTPDLAVLEAELPEPDYDGAALTPATRLGALVQDVAFADFARDLIEHHRNALRQGAKEWAALMMWAESSQHLLNALGKYAEEHLSRVAYHLHCDRASREGDWRKIVDEWVVADVKGRVLLNELWGASTRYRVALPPEAEGVDLATAFADQGAVGPWRPARLYPPAQASAI